MASQVSDTEQKTGSIPPPNRWLVPVLAAWIIPGGGHFVQKRTGRGVLIFLSVFLMFLFGMFMRGMIFSPARGDLLTTLINYGGFICDLATGALYFITSMFGYAQPDMPGADHDYGTKFLVTAGLLNILAMVDSFEIAAGRKS